MRNDEAAAAFLNPLHLIVGGPHRFVTQIERLLWHLGFDDVRNIDGSGDEGGDILALKGQERWVVQCKWRKAGPKGTVNRAGIDEVDLARYSYRCERALLVTNAALDAHAERRVQELDRTGAGVDVIPASRLSVLSMQVRSRVKARYGLREYQKRAVDRIKNRLHLERRALLILATGLGKTVVGATVVADYLVAHPKQAVLVVAHMKDLVSQLEKALWRHLPKTIVTHMLTGEVRPTSFDGVICATVESALGAVRHGLRPGLVMVDETHHLAETGMFAELLHCLGEARQFGVTATPWRGDKYDIETHFGKAVDRIGIADGMRMGYLAQVNYRLMLDNLDHDMVRASSRYQYTIKELNRRLFLPQRDQAVADELVRAWNAIRMPRAIVFCETVESAERFASALQKFNPSWNNSRPIHAGMPRRKRDVLLAEFRRGDVPILCAVDVLNEGIDVPDVNLLVFLRVTHSRRIFIQQLGRGLRLSRTKKFVTVLDFVSDLRRIAEVMELKRNLAGEPEEVRVPYPSSISFSDAGAESFMNEWIKDAASLATAHDEVKLNYPDPAGWNL